MGIGEVYEPPLFFIYSDGVNKEQLMIYAYHRPCAASKLAKELRVALEWPGGRYIKNRRSFLPRVNWGYRGEFRDADGAILNRFVSPAASKMQAFTLLAAAELNIPRWSQSAQALRIMLREDRAIIARRDGLSGGRGMVLVEPGVEPSTADFYVEKLSYRREFRIHVFQEQVIHRQGKFIPPGFSGLAKNFENGCIYTGQELERFADDATWAQLEQLALRSVAALGLDFGAVDLLQNKHGHLYVLEVNTAPGLRSQSSFLAYKSALQRLWVI